MVAFPLLSSQLSCLSMFMRSMDARVPTTFRIPASRTENRKLYILQIPIGSQSECKPSHQKQLHMSNLIHQIQTTKLCQPIVYSLKYHVQKQMNANEKNLCKLDISFSESNWTNQHLLLLHHFSQEEPARSASGFPNGRIHWSKGTPRRELCSQVCHMR